MSTKSYMAYLESKGYEIIDEEEGLVLKEDTFYKLFSTKQACWLVMERRAFIRFCKEEAKKGSLRLNNQFEFISNKVLKEVVG